MYNLFQWNGSGKFSNKCPSPESQLQYDTGPKSEFPSPHWKYL